MIAVRVEGRLGNQLFQYAFIYSAAKRLNTSFYIDKGIEKFKLYDYFEIEKDLFYPLDRYVFSIAGFKNILNHHFKRFFYNISDYIFLQKRIIMENSSSTVKEALESLKDTSHYLGFYQSENYFLPYSREIRQLFTLKKKVADSYKIKFEKTLPTDKKLVAVHIRKTDYQGMGNLNLGGEDLSLPFSYYHNAIKELDWQTHYFIFTSDDQSGVEAEFDYLPFKHISYDDEITDFQHILNADICVIANSTFSWWGAYLNYKPHKQIIAPKYFIGWRIKKQVPLEIYPPNWTLIEVE